MPIYGSAPSANTGLGATVWNNELVVTSPAASSVSVPVCMARSPHAPNYLSVEVAFSADPGTFAIDLQVADTDQEKYYVKAVTMNGGLNATFVGRLEVTNLVAKFARLKMVTKTNAVNVTAKIS